MKEENVIQIKSGIMINSMFLLIRFNKIAGFIKLWDGTRYVILFRSEKYDSI